jgi:hypothetical protein
MRLVFEPISTQLGQGWKTRKAPTARRAFLCQCGRPVFFRNSVCLACNTPLGYAPPLGKMLPLQAGPHDGTWVAFEGASSPQESPQSRALYRRCGNFSTAAACNWLVQTDAQGAASQSLCECCRLNRTIPDLSVPHNQALWLHIELAKRRLVSSLMALGLPVRSKLTEDPQHGLAFNFLAPTAAAPQVLTGHDNGLITINLEEADDAKREQRRADLREPYRTLLGHLRHEVGHYYWSYLVEGTPWHEPFRDLFGDERENYQAALDRHYQNGPRTDWAVGYVSAYASAHPWEDWAETWAHYLHMVDTLDTALSFGLDAENIELHYDPFTDKVLYRAPDLFASKTADSEVFLLFVNAWTELTGVLNELSRSMGQPDFYPFVLPAAAVTKLHFVHQVVLAADRARAPAAEQQADLEPAA